MLTARSSENSGGENRREGKETKGVLLERQHDGTSAVDRRRLLQLILGGSTLSAAGLLGFPLGRYLQPLDEHGSGAAASLRADELGLWEDRLVLVGDRPALVVRTDRGVVAVAAACTHLGCIVKWQKTRRQFFCPCHGARFDVEGRVLGGPAPAPLARHEVEEDSELLTIRRS